MLVDRRAAPGGDGSCWRLAYDTLQAAIAAASPGEEIWVAAGTYVPGASRTQSFTLRNGLSIYGGFAGTERLRSQRDPARNITVLSGDLRGDDAATGSISDNAYRVVNAADVDNTALLDGFTVRGGNGIGAADAAGSAIAAVAGAPHIVGCSITGNSGPRGAVYVSGRTALIEDTTFVDGPGSAGMLLVQGGSATLRRVSVRNTGYESFLVAGGGRLDLVDSTLAPSNTVVSPGRALRSTDSTLNVTNTTISGFQGAAYIERGTASFDRCVFADNRGQVLELNEGAVGAVNARVSFTGCTFRRNRADRSSVGGSGGALWLFGASANATIDGCTFDANEAPFAPAIHSVSATLSVLRSTVQRHAAARNTSPIDAGGTVIIRGSTFTDNTSLGDGGAIFLTTASAEITDSRFVRNTASLDGGAIYSLNSTLRVARSIFASNRASATGGAIAAVLPTSGATTPVVDLTSDRFDANSALRGGAVATSVTSTTAVPLMRVTNAQFTGNTASASGGAAAFEVGRVVVVNSTFFGNTAPANPIVLGASTLSIANSALWTDGVSSFALPAGATLQWSAVPGAFVGEGNLALTASPFERQSGTDGVLGTSDDVMALAPGSPCIDAGSNALLPTDTWDLDGDGDRAEPLPRDLTDAARVVGVRVDLGAFESR